MPKIHHIKLLHFMRRLKIKLHDHFHYSKWIKNHQCKFGKCAKNLNYCNKSQEISLVHGNARILVPLIVRCLDRVSHRDWEQKIASSKEPATYDEMMNFLKERLCLLWSRVVHQGKPVLIKVVRLIISILTKVIKLLLNHII